MKVGRERWRDTRTGEHIVSDYVPQHSEAKKRGPRRVAGSHRDFLDEIQKRGKRRTRICITKRVVMDSER